MARTSSSLALSAAVVAALGLGACTTRRVNPPLSQAVMDARAHRDVAQAAACPNLVTPASVAFPFQVSDLSDVDMSALETVAATLNCRPQVSAVIVGAADAHGTDAEQKKLAQGRAQAVLDYLQAHGVAPTRLSILATDKPPTGDAGHMVVLAEGRRY